MSETNKGEVPRVNRFNEALSLTKVAILPQVSDSLWFGHDGVSGKRNEFLRINGDAGSELVSVLDNDPEARNGVMGRYLQLIGAVGGECRALGNQHPKILPQDRSELIFMAYRFESDGREYARQCQQSVESVTADPAERKALATILENRYIDREAGLMKAIAIRINVRENVVRKGPDNNKYIELARRWVEAGNGLEAQSNDARVAEAQRVADAHKDIVAMSTEQGGYYHLIPKANNPVLRANNLKETKYTNRAQSDFENKLGRLVESDIRAIPTGDLVRQFQELSTIGNEIKIHLMPPAARKPEFFDRVLSLLEKYPNLRDMIDELKLGLRDNSKDIQGNTLPEIVIYTSAKNYQSVLGPILTEFASEVGTGRVPRFNQEVAHKLIYMAQSGGDLKLALGQVLDKFFDASHNFAKLRPGIRL